MHIDDEVTARIAKANVAFGRMLEMLLFVCVLRWLIRPILALNCLLQMEQQRSEQDSSVCNAFLPHIH